MVIEAFSGFEKKINSTKRPSGGTQITCTLKDGTSVLNPVFLLTGYNLSHNYVIWGNRYYFIDDIVIVGNSLAEYHCSTDILATYKNNIGASSQYVLRSASTFDGSVTDAFYPVKAQKSTSKTSQANGFIFPQGGAFVFGIQGATSGNSFGSTTYYVLDVYQAKTLMQEIFNISNSDYESSVVESASGLPEAVYKSIINPQQYIVSCVYLPFDAESVGSGASTPIMLGWYDVGVSGLIFDTSFDALPTLEHTFTLTKHPQNARGVYMNNAPFTEYVLSFMPFGEIPLPADLLINATQIHTKLIVDVVTGQGTLKIYAGSDASGQLIESRSAQVGVPIAVSSGIYDYRPSSVISKGIASVLSFAGMLGKGTETMADIGKIGEASISPSINTMGSNGALDFLEYDVILYSRFTYVVDDDNTQHGRPLCSVRTINTLSGYTQCFKPDLDISASPTEKEAIIRYMEGGFYYE